MSVRYLQHLAETLAQQSAQPDFGDSPPCDILLSAVGRRPRNLDNLVFREKLRRERSRPQQARRWRAKSFEAPYPPGSRGTRIYLREVVRAVRSSFSIFWSLRQSNRSLHLDLAVNPLLLGPINGGLMLVWRRTVDGVFTHHFPAFRIEFLHRHFSRALAVIRYSRIVEPPTSTHIYRQS